MLTPGRVKCSLHEMFSPRHAVHRGPEKSLEFMRFMDVEMIALYYLRANTNPTEREPRDDAKRSRERHPVPRRDNVSTCRGRPAANLREEVIEGDRPAVHQRGRGNRCGERPGAAPRNTLILPWNKSEGATLAPTLDNESSRDIHYAAPRGAESERTL